ncbi:MAG: hypothetical protein FJY67_05645 [Calditrichaeota bacterium]|nr:hypothetical protein [Calditrichota bacterium]
MNDTPPIMPLDAEARARARGEGDWLWRTLQVEAGAGTGKTTLLSERVAHLIAAEGLSSFVAMTFTVKAAAELADRVRRKLEATLVDGGASLPVLQALRDIDSASLSTIHSFAARILRSYPLECGVAPDFEVIDAIAEELLFNEVFLAALSEDHPARDLMIERFLTLGGSLERLRALMLDLSRRGHGAYVFNPMKVDLSAATAISKELRELRTFAKSAVITSDDKALIAIQELEHTVTSESDADDSSLISQLFTIAGAPNAGRLGNAGNWRSKADLDWVRTTLSDLRARAEGLLESLKSAALINLLNWGRGAIATFEKRKRDSGILSNDDLLNLTHILLGQPAVAEELRIRFGRLLVDEFQDTDIRQAAIVRILTGQTGEETTPNPGPGRLFLVGDPKQSIYRFRNADARIYRAMRDWVGGGESEVAITQNFRSTEGIIAFVNAFCEPLWAETGDRYIPITASQERDTPSSGPAVKIIRSNEDNNNQDKSRGEADGVLQREAGLIAHSIKKMLDEGWTVLDRHSIASRPVRCGDIAVLYASISGRTSALSDMLDSLGIPFQISGGKDQLKKQVAADLKQVLAVIDDPHDSGALFAALRSCFFGVQDGELVRYWQCSRSMRRDLEPVEDAGPELRRGLAILQNLRAIKHRSSVESLIENLYEVTGVREALSIVSSEGEGDAALLDVLKARSTGSSRGRAVTLRQFRRELDIFIESGDLPAAASPVRPDRVVLSTIHSAKGLEYPVVFLANINRDIERANSTGNLPGVLQDPVGYKVEVRIGSQKGGYFATPGYAPAAEIEEREIHAEEYRKLYVALTRARDHLLLPYPVAGEPKGYLKLLNDFVNGENLFVGRKDDLFGWLDISITDNAVEQPHQEHTGLEISSLEAAGLEAFVRARQYHQSVSQNLLTLSDRILHPGIEGSPIVDDTKSALSTPQGDGRAHRIGSAVHRYLAISPLTTQLDVGLLQKVAAEERLEADEIAGFLERAVTGPIWKAALQAKRVHREMPLLTLSVDRLMSGRIDILWQSVDSRIGIADFKTGREDLDSHTRQLEEYARGLHIALRQPVDEAWIHYLYSGRAVQVTLETGDL